MGNKKLGFFEKLLEESDEFFRKHVDRPKDMGRRKFFAKFKMAASVDAILYFSMQSYRTESYWQIWMKFPEIMRLGLRMAGVKHLFLKIQNVGVRGRHFEFAMESYGDQKMWIFRKVTGGIG